MQTAIDIFAVLIVLPALVVFLVSSRFAILAFFDWYESRRSG